MLPKEYIQKIREILQEPPLNDIQELVLNMCWEGKTYTEIATFSKYEESYIRDIGSKLWQRLSKQLNLKVSKHNLRGTLQKYLNEELPTTKFFWNQANNLNSYHTSSSSNIIVPGNILPLNSDFYINRPPYEEIAYRQIRIPGSILKIRSPEKMGKSSLLIRTLSLANQQNYKTIEIDFKQVELANLQNIDIFLGWLCKNVAYQLDIPGKLNEFWSLDLGAKVSCSLFFKTSILKQIETPLVLAFNDLDKLFKYPQIAQDFLPLIRFWHEQANQNPIWQKLRIILTYSTENYIPLNLHQSPFNVGTTIKLPPLTRKQVGNFISTYNSIDNFDYQNPETLLDDLYSMVGGHPYLIHLALYYHKYHYLDWQEILELAPTEEGIYTSHLHHLASIINSQSQLKKTLIKLTIAQRPIKIDSLSAYQLEGLGIICRIGNLVRLSCLLYRLYFRHILIVT